MMIAEYVGYAFMPAGILVAVWAASAGLRGHRRPLWSVATTAAGLTFAALAPLGCGMLTSFPPYTSCTSLSGFGWGFHPALDSFWNNNYTVLTAQAVLLGYAAAMAAAVLAVTWLAPRLAVRPTRHR